MSGECIELLAGTRQPRESDEAIVACNDYLRLGVGRSLQKLVVWYRSGTEVAPENPTKRIRTLKKWSTQFNWQDRATAYDAEQERRKTVEIERLKTEGLAADYARIRELDDLYQELKADFARRGLYLDDVKLSPTGKTVTVEVFNKPLVDSLRNVLDDIAKEVGGRKVVQENIHKGDKDRPIVLDAPALQQAADELRLWREEQCRLLANWQNVVPTQPTSPTPTE